MISDEELRQLVCQMLEKGKEDLFSSFLQIFTQSYGRSYGDLRAVLEHISYNPSFSSLVPQVGNFVLVWIQEWPEGVISGSLKSKLLTLCERTMDPEQLNKAKLIMLKGSNSSNARAQPRTRSSSFSSFSSSFSSSSEQQQSGFILLDSRTSELAACLTFIEWEDFRLVQSREFSNKNWQGPAKDTTAPNLTRMAKRFNTISQWCVLTILQSKSPAIVVEKLISLLSMLVSMNNYQSAGQIAAALDHATVSRLRNSVWKKLNPPLVKEFKECCEIVSPVSNYAAYRFRVARCLEAQKPVLPYLAVWLRDLIYAYDGNFDRLEDGSWNIQKVSLVADLFQVFRTYQKQSFSLQVPELLWFYLNHLQNSFPDDLSPDQEEEELYAMSLMLEPAVSRVHPESEKLIQVGPFPPVLMVSSSSFSPSSCSLSSSSSLSPHSSTSTSSLSSSLPSPSLSIMVPKDLSRPLSPNPPIPPTSPFGLGPTSLTPSPKADCLRRRISGDWSFSSSSARLASSNPIHREKASAPSSAKFESKKILDELVKVSSTPVQIPSPTFFSGRNSQNLHLRTTRSANSDPEPKTNFVTPTTSASFTGGERGSRVETKGGEVKGADGQCNSRTGDVPPLRKGASQGKLLGAPLSPPFKSSSVNPQSLLSFLSPGQSGDFASLKFGQKTKNSRKKKVPKTAEKRPQNSDLGWKKSRNKINGGKTVPKRLFTAQVDSSLEEGEIENERIKFVTIQEEPDRFSSCKKEPEEMEKEGVSGKKKKDKKNIQKGVREEDADIQEQEVEEEVGEKGEENRAKMGEEEGEEEEEEKKVEESLRRMRRALSVGVCEETSPVWDWG